MLVRGMVGQRWRLYASSINVVLGPVCMANVLDPGQCELRASRLVILDRILAVG